MRTQHILLTVAGPALALAGACWLGVLGIVVFRTEWLGPNTLTKGFGLFLIIVIPDGTASWWLFRKVNISRSEKDARRAATAFAVSAPLALGLSNLLGELVGGYSAIILGEHAILPAVTVMIVIVMVLVPGTVVFWALHPSGEIGPIRESDQNEHR